MRKVRAAGRGAEAPMPSKVLGSLVGLSKMGARVKGEGEEQGEG
jgi:hypothetical protein